MTSAQGHRADHGGHASGPAATPGPRRRRLLGRRWSPSAVAALAAVLAPLAMAGAGATTTAPASPPVGWSQMHPQTVPPRGPTIGQGGAVAYDGTRKQVVMFAGGDGTWTWNGTDWAHHASNPEGGAGFFNGAMAYDPIRGQLVYFDSHSATTSLWNGTAWAPVRPLPRTSPPPRHATTMAFDGDKIILFGGGEGDAGDTPYNDTWSWEGTTWKNRDAKLIDGQLDPLKTPKARKYHTMAYDAANNEVVLFGGEAKRAGVDFDYVLSTREMLSDTWVWKGGTVNAWTERKPQKAPPPRALHAMSYDSGTQRMILHGGQGHDTKAYTDYHLCKEEDPTAECPEAYPENPLYDEGTWAWDGLQWTERNVRPPVRVGDQMAYDAAHGYHLRVGGMARDAYRTANPSTEIWAYRDSSVPTPGDFGGDATTDIALYRPTNGTWYVRGASPDAVAYGAPGDIPTPGDYDGNGTLDMALFRPTNGTWYIRGASPDAVAYGVEGDIPTPGDYNGDGTTDIAVFRPATGTWYVRGASPDAVAYGTAGDVPVPGDYDGDATTDIALFRPDNGTWYVRGASPDAVAYGTAGDVPTPGHYNLDGTTDMAVFRPDNGTWYIRGANPDAVLYGTDSVPYGTAGDLPLPLAPASRMASSS